MESYQRKKTGSFLLNSKTRKLVKKAIVIVEKLTQIMDDKSLLFIMRKRRNLL